MLTGMIECTVIGRPLDVDPACGHRVETLVDAPAEKTFRSAR
jgi:hypothetical protein